MADDFTEQLNAVLGNPEAMGQIMSIARALTGDGNAAPPQASPSQAPPPPPPAEPEPLEAAPPALPPQAPQSAAPDLSGMLNRLGGLLNGGSGGGALQNGGGNPLSALADLDPRLIQLGMRLISEYNSPADDKTALLAALRPFVKEERFAKVDRAIQAARLARVVRAALRMFRESKEGGEGEHV